MTLELLKLAHERETMSLLMEIIAFRKNQRLQSDSFVYDGFMAQVQMLKNIGICLSHVEACEQELYQVALEIFPQ